MPSRDGDSVDGDHGHHKHCDDENDGEGHAAFCFLRWMASPVRQVAAFVLSGATSEVPDLEWKSDLLFTLCSGGCIHIGRF